MIQAREIAAKILNNIHKNNTYANITLANTFSKYELNDFDRRFITELVYGTLKLSNTIDWILCQYTSRPLKKIPLVICEILRLGIYQLFFLNKIPASAICNEATELAKKYTHPGTVKFVNAVLRAAAREPQKASFSILKNSPVKYIAIKYGHPDWLVKNWIEEYGYEATKKLCDFNNSPALLSIRANTLKISRDELIKILNDEGVKTVPSEWTDCGIHCIEHPALDKLQSLKKGLFQVQDESSMQVGFVVNPLPGEFIIDACSAPGGKTTHMAEIMKNKGRIVAFDIYDEKLKRINENAKRLGITIIETKNFDARNIGNAYPNMADKVLVDAPCSGLGVLRRKPDARWRKDKKDLDNLPKLQMEILCSAAKAVKPGGVLVYSTCTITKAENQAIIDKFLKIHPEFHVENTGSYLPIKKSNNSLVQFYPHIDNIDGFFIARMKRAGKNEN